MNIIYLDLDTLDYKHEHLYEFWKYLLEAYDELNQDDFCYVLIKTPQLEVSSQFVPSKVFVLCEELSSSKQLRDDLKESIKELSAEMEYDERESLMMDIRDSISKTNEDISVSYRKLRRELEILRKRDISKIIVDSFIQVIQEATKSIDMMNDFKSIMKEDRVMQDLQAALRRQDFNEVINIVGFINLTIYDWITGIERDM